MTNYLKWESIYLVFYHRFLSFQTFVRWIPPSEYKLNNKKSESRLIQRWTVVTRDFNSPVKKARYVMNLRGTLQNQYSTWNSLSLSLTHTHTHTHTHIFIWYSINNKSNNNNNNLKIFIFIYIYIYI